MTEQTGNEVGEPRSKLARLLGLLKRAGLAKLAGWLLVAVFAYQFWDRINLGYGTSIGALLAIGLLGAGFVLLSGDRNPTGTNHAVLQTKRPRSPLFLLTISGLLVVVGGALGLGASGAAVLGTGQLTALALVVVGLGLVVGAFVGRARLLIPLGLLLVPAVLASSFIHFSPRGHIGSRYLYAQNVRSLEELEGTHRMLFGDLSMDLTEIAPEDFGDREIDIEVSAGNFSLYVPAGIDLKVTGTVGLGNATIGRGREAGTHLSLQESFEGIPDAGSLTVLFHGGVASIYVERISYRERYGVTRKQQELREERRAERFRNERRAERRREERRAERFRNERRAERRREERRAERFREERRAERRREERRAERFREERRAERKAESRKKERPE